MYHSEVSTLIIAYTIVVPLDVHFDELKLSIATNFYFGDFWRDPLYSGLLELQLFWRTVQWTDDNID